MLYHPFVGSCTGEISKSAALSHAILRKAFMFFFFFVCVMSPLFDLEIHLTHHLLIHVQV